MEWANAMAVSAFVKLQHKSPLEQKLCGFIFVRSDTVPPFKPRSALFGLYIYIYIQQGKKKKD